jgi:hypothetical protein
LSSKACFWHSKFSFVFIWWTLKILWL